MTNWRRGLMRLWIAASVVWIAFSFWEFHPIQKFREATAPIVVTICNTGIEFPHGTPVSEVKKALTGFVQSRKYKPCSAYASMFGVDSAIDEAMNQFHPQPISETVLPMTVEILLPPLLALAAGLAGFWIASGFLGQPRPDSN